MRQSNDAADTSDRPETPAEAEARRQQLLEISRPAVNTGLRGVERVVNDKGDRLFTSTMRSPEQVQNESGAYSNERMFLRTIHAGQETGRSSASIQIQRDEYGIVSNRMRIHDIVVNPPYRGEGHGDTMLKEIELHAKRFGATEVYGLYSYDGDPDKVRAFYQRNGYRFRTVDNREEVFKPLPMYARD